MDSKMLFRAKVSDSFQSFINPPARQLVGKTRWVFRQPQGVQYDEPIHRPYN
jgi:hypothetical protein